MIAQYFIDLTQKRSNRSTDRGTKAVVSFYDHFVGTLTSRCHKCKQLSTSNQLPHCAKLHAERETLTSGHFGAVVVKLAFHPSTRFSHGCVELLKVVNTKLSASGWGWGQGVWSSIKGKK